MTQGFLQTEGINDNETFALIAKLSAICIITAIAARNDWELEQTYIDGAYINATLKEIIYMHQPKGYKAPRKKHHICLLKHALQYMV